MRQNPHSILVPILEPPLSRREKAALTAALLMGVAVVVMFAYALTQLALRLAAAMGWEGW